MARLRKASKRAACVPSYNFNNIHDKREISKSRSSSSLKDWTLVVYQLLLKKIHVLRLSMCMHGRYTSIVLCQKTLAWRSDLLFLNKKADAWSCDWQPRKTQNNQTQENPWVLLSLYWTVNSCNHGISLGRYTSAKFNPQKAGQIAHEHSCVGV
jgi:hypothetical protein